MWEGFPLKVTAAIVIVMAVISTLASIRAYKGKMDPGFMAVLAWFGMMIMLNGLIKIVFDVSVWILESSN